MGLQIQKRGIEAMLDSMSGRDGIGLIKKPFIRSLKDRGYDDSELQNKIIWKIVAPFENQIKALPDNSLDLEEFLDLVSKDIDTNCAEMQEIRRDHKIGLLVKSTMLQALRDGVLATPYTNDEGLLMTGWLSPYLIDKSQQTPPPAPIMPSRQSTTTVTTGSAPRQAPPPPPVAGQKGHALSKTG